jgi:hypothetical protein
MPWFMSAATALLTLAHACCGAPSRSSCGLAPAISSAWAALSSSSSCSVSSCRRHDLLLDRSMSTRWIALLVQIDLRPSPFRRTIGRSQYVSMPSRSLFNFFSHLRRISLISNRAAGHERFLTYPLLYAVAAIYQPNPAQEACSVSAELPRSIMPSAAGSTVRRRARFQPSLSAWWGPWSACLSPL